MNLFDNETSQAQEEALKYTGRMPADTYTFFEDGGHGWLQVPKLELIALGIEKEITGYSYMRGAYAYLEEDLDLTTYLNAKYHSMYERQLFMKGTQNKYQDNSDIRNFQHYQQ